MKAKTKKVQKKQKNKNRYFTHTDKFSDGTVFIIIPPKNDCRICVNAKNEKYKVEEPNCLKSALGFVSFGLWKEITEEQSKELLNSSKDEKTS